MVPVLHGVRLVAGRLLSGVVAGAVAGLASRLAAAPVVLDGNYEYFRYVSTWLSVSLFALLYPLYGLVLSPLTERLGQGVAGRQGIVLLRGPAT